MIYHLGIITKTYSVWQCCRNSGGASYLSCRQPLVPTVTTNSRIRPMVLARIKIFHARDMPNKHPISVSCVCVYIYMQLINVKEQKGIWMIGTYLLGAAGGTVCQGKGGLRCPASCPSYMSGCSDT